jgi:transcription initiation factor TFIIIB Brf1 subunit/transcription initiation factor TFIIB
MIDVSSEWRTFANDKESTDMTRVGAAEDPTMEGNDLSTVIGRATGSAGFDANGMPIYRNRNAVIIYYFNYFLNILDFIIFNLRKVQ